MSPNVLTTCEFGLYKTIDTEFEVVYIILLNTY